MGDPEEAPGSRLQISSVLAVAASFLCLCESGLLNNNKINLFKNKILSGWALWYISEATA